MNIFKFAEILLADPTIKFYPWYGLDQPTFQYDNMEFQPNIGVGYKMHMEFNNTKPDVWVSMPLIGTVRFAESISPPISSINTVKFHTFKLFSDGKPNVDSMVLSLNPSQHKRLFAELDHKNMHSLGHGLFRVPLKALTFNNKATEFSAIELGKLELELVTEKCYLKVYNSYAPKSTSTFINEKLSDKYDASVVEFLVSHNINDSGFTPKASYKSSTPWMEVKVAGFSSLPKVSEVAQRIKDNKKQTTAGAVMANAINIITTSSPSVELIVQTIKEMEEKQKAITEAIRDIKYGLYLTDSWFEEFTEKSTNTLTINEAEVMFVYNGK